MPKAKSEIVWLINYIDHSLADRRNDVIHSSFSFMTDNSGTRLKSDFFSENPRAIKLFEKELLAEFTWYQLTASVLSGYAANIVGRVSNFSEPSKSLRTLIEVRNSFVP